MADQKISQLNRLTGSQVDNANDVLPIVDASANETKAISRAEFMKNIPDATFSGSTSGIDYNDLDNLPPSGETPNDSTVTIVAGTGLTGGGSFTLNQATPAEITLNATGGGGGGDQNSYRTRVEANAAMTGAPDGTLFYVNGVEAVVDSSATGTLSVFHDISGGVPAKLTSGVVDTWFFEVGTNQNSDDTANLIAANTYATSTQTATGGAVKFVVAGFLTITSPVTIGQTLEGFEIDMGGAHIEVPSGWTGASTDYVLDLRGRTATKKLPFINCNKRANGIRFGNNAGSTIIGGAVYRMTEIGFRVSGSNCTFINQFGYEYDNGDPEFNTDSNFVADVVRIVDNDLKMISTNVGWAACPIRIMPGAAEVELIAPHPFNGNPNADGVTVQPRDNPYCIISEAGGRVFISDLYLDNGYLDDRTANIELVSGRDLILTNRVSVTEPLFRVNADAAEINTIVTSYTGRFGFYTGPWQNNASNLVTDIHESAFSGASKGDQRMVEVRGRRTTVLRSGGVDFNYVKRGGSSETLTVRHRPGTGEPVDFQMQDGVFKISSGLSGDVSVAPATLQLYEDGDTGNAGSEIRMKQVGSSNTSTITVSAGEILVDGQPIGGNGLITEDPTTGAKFIVSGSADDEAGVLNLYPQGTDGVGIGVSYVGWSAAGGSDLVKTNMRANGVLVTTLDDGVTEREQSSVSQGHNIGSGTTIDPTNGYFQYIALSSAKTLDIANFNNYDRVLLDVRNADSNTLTITSSSGTIRWAGGSAPSSYGVRTLFGIARRGSDIFIGAVGF